jgi:sugar lactone lactonase YvrE
MEKNGQLTVLADHYEGKRLNSPNDLVYKSDGALYFTIRRSGCRSFSTIRAKSCRTAESSASHRTARTYNS